MFRKRTERRAAERALQKLVDQRVKLFFMSDGGSQEHPVVVDSASLVELRAASIPCAKCLGSLRLQVHDAVVLDGAILRAARMRCMQCATLWTIWFRIERRLAN